MGRPKQDEIKVLARAILALAPEKRAELDRTIALVEELEQPAGAPAAKPPAKRGRKTKTTVVEVGNVGNP